MHTDPIKVVQFGEGNFLRGFMDWMIQTMNDQDLFHGRVAVCVPIPGKKDEPWASCHCEYTLAKRGIVDGQIVHEQEPLLVLIKSLAAMRILMPGWSWQRFRRCS